MSDTRLIIGAHRDNAREAFCQQHALAIGSLLVVCDSTDDGLWSTQKQTEILEQHGCTVQVMIQFEHGERHSSVGGGGVQPGTRRYTFEAALDPEVLLSDDRTDNIEETLVSMADIDARATDGVTFWSTASEVKLG